MSEEIKMEEQVVVEPVDQAGEMANVSTVKKGDIVKGTVVKVEDNQAFVDIGYKYDGVVPLRELSAVNLDNASQIVEKGQELTLKVVSINDGKESLVLSKRAVEAESAWEKLQGQLDSKEVLEAKVADVVKGGLVVDVGVRGFVPASMVERHFVEDFSDYKGRVLRLIVKELDKVNNKLILSQKDVLELEHNEQKKRVISELKPDQVIEGTVQRLTPFGAFVDIGGIDGLVHVSEMAWHHVDKPSDVVKEGDKVSVRILKLDPENERISLSMKAAQPGPWDRVNSEFAIGGIVEGTVKRLVSFGAFVEIAPGVEGLVHISQIAHRHVGTPHEVLKEGDTVKVKILDINKDEKRVSLSIKETEDAPAQAPRPDRPKREPKQPETPEVQSLSMTLGERFGDKLSKFK